MLLTSVPVLGGRTAPMAYALRQAREIAERLAAPTEVAGVRMSVEVSVGVVVADAGTADLTELLRRADIAMYQAKEGGGSVAAYDSSRDAASTDQRLRCSRSCGRRWPPTTSSCWPSSRRWTWPPARRPGWRR